MLTLVPLPPPLPHQPLRPRSSLIKFNGLDGDAVVQPLPQWVGGGFGPAKFEAVAQGAHIDAEMAQGEKNLTEYSSNHPE